MAEEARIEKYLVDQVNAHFGLIRKVQWIGRVGAPDRVVMIGGRTIWVELKAPGEKPRAVQLREHSRMRAAGQDVRVIDSFDGVDKLMGELF